MSNELPDFAKRPYQQVHELAGRLFAHGEDNHLYKLIAYKDGHYRALFGAGFFTLAEGQTEPSKSQWRTLKKRLKRMDKRAFVFKAHGVADCETGGTDTIKARCYYLDFGFFKD